MEYGSKELILRTAISLISRFGFDSVTIRQIARESGRQGASVYNHFNSKEDLLDHILAFIYREITLYDPSNEELDSMLAVRSPGEVLQRFHTYYDEYAGELWQELYRILFMGMYRDDRFMEATYRLVVNGPKKILERALRHMMETQAIPPGDSRNLAEIWTRATIVYSFQNAHKANPVNWREYEAMNRFFIQMALRGVTPVPLEQMKVEWNLPFAQSAPLPHGTKGKILQAALHLFSQYGYGNVSMREIAIEVGIKAGSIYSHFPSKESIMQELTATFWAGYETYTAQSPAFRGAVESKDPARIALYISSAYPPELSSYSYLVYRILFREQFHNDELRFFFLTSIEKDRRAIEEMLLHSIEAGYINPCETTCISIAHVHTMVSLSLSASVENPIVDEIPLRLASSALLLGLVLYGYNYGPGEWQNRHDRLA